MRLCSDVWFTTWVFKAKPNLRRRNNHSNPTHIPSRTAAKPKGTHEHVERERAKVYDMDV
jgi:hypothetical protein